jgi:hypothetical protein
MRDTNASGWHQQNTANGGSVYATQGGGDIVISGQPSSPVRERIRVLMLAANPLSTARLAIDEEARQITERLRLARDRDAFELITCWAVRPMDLLQYLNQHSPHIVHISGHGDRTGEIVLSADDGSDRRVSAAALAALFRATNDNIRVVVLNACHSAAAVQAIGPYVDFIVGMRAPITDAAATTFAAAFYTALGFGRTIPQAFDQAVAVLGMHDPAGQHIPELVTRPNANPHVMEGAR